MGMFWIKVICKCGFTHYGYVCSVDGGSTDIPEKCPDCNNADFERCEYNPITGEVYPPYNMKKENYASD